MAHLANIIATEQIMDKSSGKVTRRKVLGNVKFDKAAGEFVPREIKKLNRFNTVMEVDSAQYNKMLKKLECSMPKVGMKEVVAISIGDTGATVTCCGTNMMRELGMR